MHRGARTTSQIVFAAAVWTSCFPVVSACDTPGCEDYTPLQIRAGVIAAGVGLFLFSVIAYICLRRRRLRQRTTQLPSNGVVRNQASYLRKPSYCAPQNGYPAYYQASPPSPPAAHVPPQYPPRGYDTYHGNSHSPWTSFASAHRVPEQVGPVSPRAPSSATPWPASSSQSPRSSVRQDQSSTRISRTPDTPSLASPRSPRREIEAPLSPQHTSTSLRSTPAVKPAAAPASTPPSTTARPSAVSPMHTGASSNRFNEPPPAYTPV